MQDSPRIMPRELRLSKGARFGVAFLAVLAVALWFGCASPPSEDCEKIPNFGIRCTSLAAPDPGTFKTAGVSNFLEKRCGTLDCHGQKGRAMRVYGLNGLRAPREGGVDPNLPTTDEEIASNFRSLVSLEPEELTRVVRTGQNADRLLVLEKAISYDPNSPDQDKQGVQHKGGAVVRRGDDGYRCMADWIGGQPNQTACTNAAGKY